MPTNINRKGITNVGFVSAPKMMDHSGSHFVKVTDTGSTIRKQIPGMNNSIVPLIPEPKGR